MNPALRPHPGRRPAVPVRQDSPPDDHLCAWSYRVAVWSGSEARGFWELKYINSACAEHARLAFAV